jgi:hypothetical protein
MRFINQPINRSYILANTVEIDVEEGKVMNILSILSFAMIAVILMSMLAKARPYAKIKAPGKTLTIIPVTLLSKLWLNRFSLAALTTGLIFTTAAGWLQTNMAFMVIAFALVILLIPMKLTITSQGLAMGDAFFRPWSDFSGVKMTRSKLELQNPSIFKRVILFLKPSKIEPYLKTIEKAIPA